MWGRKKEIELLQDHFNSRTSQLVVIKGRRRIGKSTLARYFGQKQGNDYFEFSGLAPTPGQTNQDQLDEFFIQLKRQLPTRKDSFSDWSIAFDELAYLLKRKKKVVILMDEISWMGKHDINFAGKLKTAWDIYFSQNPQFMIILCGSVSSWIQENILNSTHFVGRISLSMTLGELPLAVCSKFWGKNISNVTRPEVIQILSIYGCIPRYLEEVNSKKTVKDMIKNQCFDSSGFFNDEFEKIFSDILGIQAPTYKKIMVKLIEKKMSPQALSKALGLSMTGSFTEYLTNLEISGFLARDYSFQLSSTKSKINQYRIKDNFSRFSLKYIEPNKLRLKNLENSFKGLEFLPQWPAILGLQFENLVLNHLDEVLLGLNISPSTVITASPYIQRKKTRNLGACQIDLMIQTQENNAYVCELKFENEINRSIIKEVQTKIQKLVKKRNWTYRPVLIYEGELNKNDSAEIQNYFSRILRLSDLIEGF